MPRLRQVPRSEAPTETVIAAYDRLFSKDRDPVSEPGTATGTPGNWWTVFALSPEVFHHAVAGFSVYQKSADRLDPALRELGQTRAGWLAGSQFVYSQHCKSCRALGISDDKIRAISGYQVSELFSPIERAVLAYTDALALAGGRVDDAVFETLRDHLSDEEILELTYITTMYVMHAIMSRALRTEWDDRSDPVVEVAGPEGGEARDIGADIAVDS